jgi:hypothetical protein
MEKYCRAGQARDGGVYEIMWKNIVEPDRPQMAIWRMRIARWIIKATDPT